MLGGSEAPHFYIRAFDARASRVDVDTILQLLIAAMLTGALPWAFKIHGLVKEIVAELRLMRDEARVNRKIISDTRRRVRLVETEIAVVKEKVSAMEA